MIGGQCQQCRHFSYDYLEHIAAASAAKCTSDEYLVKKTEDNPWRRIGVGFSEIFLPYLLAPSLLAVMRGLQ